MSGISQYSIIFFQSVEESLPDDQNYEKNMPQPYSMKNETEEENTKYCSNLI